MPSPTAPSPLDFHPDDSLAARIVADLAEPTASLASVAESHRIPVATLALWLNSPRAVALLHAIESGTCRHLRMATSIHLPKAVDALLTILDHYKKLATTLDPDDPDLLRAASRARIAAYHLFRLSRATPLTDEQIALAAARAAERAASRAPANPAARAPARAAEHTASAPGGTFLQSSDAAGCPPSAPVPAPASLGPSASASPQCPSPVPSSPHSSASPVFNTSPSSPLRDSESSATFAFSSPSLPSSPLSSAFSSPFRSPAELILAATGPPVAAS